MPSVAQQTSLRLQNSSSSLQSRRRGVFRGGERLFSLKRVRRRVSLAFLCSLRRWWARSGARPPLRPPRSPLRPRPGSPPTVAAPLKASLSAACAARGRPRARGLVEQWGYLFCNPSCTIVFIIPCDCFFGTNGPTQQGSPGLASKSLVRGTNITSAPCESAQCLYHKPLVAARH